MRQIFNDFSKKDSIDFLMNKLCMMELKLQKIDKEDEKRKKMTSTLKIDTMQKLSKKFGISSISQIIMDEFKKDN